MRPPRIHRRIDVDHDGSHHAERVVRIDVLAAIAAGRRGQQRDDGPGDDDPGEDSIASLVQLHGLLLWTWFENNKSNGYEEQGTYQYASGE